MSQFQHTYVISLRHKTKRKEQITAELERVGITNWSFYTGADGKKKDIQEIAKRLQILEPETLSYFSPGHLGCLVSHYTLWLQIYLSAPSDSWTLILEDDARFHPSVSPEYLNQIWNDLPSEACLAKFHSSNGYKDNPVLFSEPASQFWMKQTAPTFSLMAYAIHTRALKTLLLTKWKNHVDLFHLDSTYIAKRPEDSELFVSTLYTSEGLFSQGICIPNNDDDSDTVDGLVYNEQTSLIPIRQVMEGQTYKEGEIRIHLYDEPTAIGMCHVFFAFQQKRFTYTD